MGSHWRLLQLRLEVPVALLQHMDQAITTSLFSRVIKISPSVQFLRLAEGGTPANWCWGPQPGGIGREQATKLQSQVSEVLRSQARASWTD